MKSLPILILLGALLLGAGLFIVSRRGASLDISQTPTAPALISQGQPVTTKETGIQQKKSLHFEQASPAHNQVFAAAPYNVTVTFNFDLAPPSKITVEKDGVDYGEGDTTIDGNKLVLRRRMKTDAPDGVYTVNYTACWPDKTCHTGEHAFTVDSSQMSLYTDASGQSSVVIDMNNIAFSAPYVVVSKGTKVTWINKESTGHYINADPHAGHNFIVSLNSQLLNKGDSYSFTFNDIGEYPYHCSAHASEMTGRIVVR